MTTSKPIRRERSSVALVGVGLALLILVVIEIWMTRTADSPERTPRAASLAKTDPTLTAEEREPMGELRDQVASTVRRVDPSGSDEDALEGALFGRVVTPMGEPVANARVSMRFSSRRQLGATATLSPVEARSDVDGRFLLRHVPLHERVAVDIAAPGFVTHEAAWWSALPSRRAVDVGDLYLDPECVIRGNVTNEQGDPIAGAEVRDHGNCLPEPPAITDASGRFEIHGVSAYRYVLLAVAPGYAPSLPPFPERELTIGEEWNDVRIVLARGTRGTGRVVDRAGVPVVGAEVVVYCAFSEQGTEGVISGGMNTPAELTDAMGRYTISAPSRQEWVLLVEAARFLPRTILLGPTNEVSMELDDVILDRPEIVRFRVVDASGEVTSLRPARVTLRFEVSPLVDHRSKARLGQPIEHHFARDGVGWRDEEDGFTIELDRSMPAIDATDRFSVVLGSMMRPTCGPFTMERAGDSGPFDVVLPYAASAHGRVINHQDDPVAAQVVLIGERENETSIVLARATTNAQGEYELVGVEVAAPLPLHLRIEPVTEASTVVEVGSIIRPGVNNEIPSIVVDPSCELAIIAFDLRGDPLANGRLAIWSDTHERLELGMTDRAGCAVFEGLPAGEWRVRLVPAQFENLPAEGRTRDWMGKPMGSDVAISLHPGERPTVRLDASTAQLARIVGVVTRRGEPLVGHEVAMIVFGRDLATVRTGPDGSYRSPLLLPCDARVAVMRHGVRDEMGAKLATLRSGEVVQLDFELDPARLVLRAVDDRGDPVACRVTLAAPVAEAERTWSDEEDHDYGRRGYLSDGQGPNEGAFEDLPPGRWQIRLEHPQGPVAAQTLFVELQPGEDRHLTVRRVGPGAWTIAIIPTSETTVASIVDLVDRDGGYVDLRASRSDGARFRQEHSFAEGLHVGGSAEPGLWEIDLVWVAFDDPDRTRLLGRTTLEVFSGQTTDATLFAHE